MSGFSFWQDFISHPEFNQMLTIPLVTAFVTWGHVWMALKMLFYPVGFWGIPVKNLPFGFPGIGWQGIVPRKAGKISGVIVDQTLTKLGSLDEFVKAMDPEEMADIIAQGVGDDLEKLIDEIMMDRNATLWTRIPNSVKRRIYTYAYQQLPHILKDLVVDLTYQVEDLVDMRKMIVHKMENDRRLMVNMFLKVGKKEIDFIWHISFAIGLFFGIVQMFVYYFMPVHWTVPFFAGLWGMLTNWIAILMVFNPTHPHYVPYIKFFRLFIKVYRLPLGKFKLPIPFVFPIPQLPHIAKYNMQGGFMKRQNEVAEVFSEVVVKDLVTIENIMNEMMYGYKAEQTRDVIKTHIHQILEAPVVKTLLRMGLGRREFGYLKNTIIDKSINATMIPIRDPELNESRAEKIFGMFRDRIRELTPEEFQNLLRPAFREDESTLIFLGAVTGVLFGALHLWLVF